MTVVASRARRARYSKMVRFKIRRAGGKNVFTVMGFASLPARIRSPQILKISRLIGSKKSSAATRPLIAANASLLLKIAPIRHCSASMLCGKAPLKMLSLPWHAAECSRSSGRIVRSWGEDDSPQARPHGAFEPCAFTLDLLRGDALARHGGALLPDRRRQDGFALFPLMIGFLSVFFLHVKIAVHAAISALPPSTTSAPIHRLPSDAAMRPHVAVPANGSIISSPGSARCSINGVTPPSPCPHS